ncbi:MAG: DNA-3-methyladenine glycosylase [Candidatus Saccharibacteria bacterium]|jgi:DNA-3-methyladenine glycosylase|nr:DNA-3-methyladenine glycosylase [Candidatus Saccharibacteria bacterium]MCA9340516.1 DNA-3-methyladenine glycosylase [Candidatus Saccharibacteria bacterium]
MPQKSLADFSFLDAPSWEVAPQLLGCELERIFDDGSVVRVKIVEVEAYDQSDEASHSYRGKTMRTETMFGSSGHLYVYFTYGMHYCANIVTSGAGRGAGVLLRAVEPITGIDIIENRRKTTGVNATNGPAKLAQALGIDFDMRGHDLRSGSLRLIPYSPLPRSQIVASPRIGISRAKDTLWRFYIKDNSYVSKPN